MATETQKNFQKQMKQIEKEHKNKNDNSVYSYVHRDFISNRVIFTKRRAITFSSFIGFIIVAVYITPYILGLYNEIIAHNQEPIISYVQKTITYDEQINQIIQLVNNNLNNLKMLSSDSRKSFTNSMNNDLTSVQSIINDASAINPPKGLEKYKSIELEQYQDVFNAINSYMYGVANNNQDNINSAQSMMNKNVTDSTRKKVELMNIFDKNKIKYEAQQDGTVRFWYNTNKPN